METIKPWCTGRGLARKGYGKDGGSRRRREQGSFLKAGRLLFRCHIELGLIPFCSTLLERKQYTPSVDRSVFQPSAFLSLSLSRHQARFHFFYKRRVIIFHSPPPGRSLGLALWMERGRERERESFHDTVKTYPRRILHRQHGRRDKRDEREGKKR